MPLSSVRSTTQSIFNFHNIQTSNGWNWHISIKIFLFHWSVTPCITLILFYVKERTKHKILNNKMFIILLFISLIQNKICGRFRNEKCNRFYFFFKTVMYWLQCVHSTGPLWRQTCQFEPITTNAHKVGTVYDTYLY